MAVDIFKKGSENEGSIASTYALDSYLLENDWEDEDWDECIGEDVES